MLNYVHGGDIQTYIDRYGAAPLDLSANINPFGIPDAVRAAMHRAVDNCTQYPLSLIHIFGNSRTRVMDGRMVTPRGYRGV